MGERIEVSQGLAALVLPLTPWEGRVSRVPDSAEIFGLVFWRYGGDVWALRASRIDRYMVKFKHSQPDFYNAYKKARRIVNHGGRPGVTAESNVVTIDSTETASNATPAKAA